MVGNELIIHGGMGWNEHTNDWDGSTDLETLDDMWILDLNTREWTRRWLFPLLVRSYHSLVGWSVDENMMGWGKEFENYTSWEGPVVAAFGGYTTGIDVFSGEVSSNYFHIVDAHIATNENPHNLYPCRKWHTCLTICFFPTHHLRRPTTTSHHHG